MTNIYHHIRPFYHFTVILVNIFVFSQKPFFLNPSIVEEKKNWPSSPKMRIIECMPFLYGLPAGCWQRGLGSHLGTSPALLLHCSFRLTSAFFCRQPKTTFWNKYFKTFVLFYSRFIRGPWIWAVLGFCETPTNTGPTTNLIDACKQSNNCNPILGRVPPLNNFLL